MTHSQQLAANVTRLESEAQAAFDKMSGAGSKQLSRAYRVIKEELERAQALYAYSERLEYIEKSNM